MAGHKQGTFLVRFSSQVGAYAVSFVGEDGSISHSLIEHEGVPANAYRIVNDGQPLVFSSLKDVVHYYGDALKYPLKNTSNEFYVEALKNLLAWKQERQKEMAVVERIVSDIFDIHKELPQFPSTSNPNSNSNSNRQLLIDSNNRTSFI